MCALTLFACDGDDGADPTPTPGGPSPTAAPSSTPEPPPDLASQIGPRGQLPDHDPIALAARYGRTEGLAPASKPAGPEPQAGSSREFVVLRLSGAALSQQVPPEIARITATLRVTSAHAYFYVDDAVEAAAADVQRAADLFEETTWPQVTSVFGPPATPGVDGDPRIIVLQADLGGAVGGYQSGDDAYLTAVRPLSNEAEMVYMDRTLRPGGAAFNVVLAHELQHLIHVNNDRGEEAWINEGLAETASGLVGGAVSSVNSFEALPETQLNAWDSEGSAPHYGAGAAFFRWLADRFGGDNSLGAIARARADGPAGVEEFLRGAGSDLGFDAVFADWIAANALDLRDGPYANERDVRASVQVVLSPGAPVSDAVNQFGTDYYALDGLGVGEYILRFEGAPAIPVLRDLPSDPVFWSNAADDIDTTLTSEVDLTGVTEPVLTFQTWFDIERWYDWGYVAVSEDGGQSWRALAGTHTTADDPVGAAYGAGFTGRSGGGDSPAWVDERIDLKPYAGKKIQLRFEYVTDGATHGEGWAVRDIAVAGASAPFTGDSAGWVNIDGPLQQTYVVRVIAGQGDGAFVQDVPVDAGGRGELRFSAAGLTDVVLAIAGTTEGTNQPASYTVELARP